VADFFWQEDIRATPKNTEHQVSCVSSFQPASSSYDAEWGYGCKHGQHNPQQNPTKTAEHRILVELPETYL
jgi:hypothetical protein